MLLGKANYPLNSHIITGSLLRGSETAHEKFDEPFHSCMYIHVLAFVGYTFRTS